MEHWRGVKNWYEFELPKLFVGKCVSELNQKSAFNFL